MSVHKTEHAYVEYHSRRHCKMFKQRALKIEMLYKKERSEHLSQGNVVMAQIQELSNRPSSENNL